MEAVQTLGVWPKPSILDRVDGYSHGPVQHDTGKVVGVATRDTAAARAALASIVTPLFGNAGTSAAGRAGRCRGPAPRHRRGLADVRQGAHRLCPRSPHRGTSRARGCSDDSRTAEAVRAALADQEASCSHGGAQRVFSPLNLPEATTTAAALLGDREGHRRRSSRMRSTALGRVQGASGREELTRLVDQLAQGKVAPEIQLEVAEAARATKNPELGAKLDAFEKSRAGKPATVAYAEALHGGDARRGLAHRLPGRVLAVHTLPQLRDRNGRQRRPAAPRCRVAPHARAAARGAGRSERAHRARLRTGAGHAEERPEVLRHAQGRDGQLHRRRREPGAEEDREERHRQRTNGPSPMPVMPTLLSRREIRDVVEYLSTLK